MATVSLDPEAIEQLSGEQKALLDAIDSLRKHGVGRFVDLPQIIVVGDQSSGKSSVLEAISRVRFPVQDGLCTRFATELVLRTDPQTRVDVRIQSNEISPSEEPYTFSETRFNKEDLPRIIQDAKTHLLKNSTAFSEDVLRVEISSPDVPHLTLVDLPGFYHSEDENQDAAGRAIVDRLVDSYMSRKNSIILAIVSARNQVILQTVLSRIKRHDKAQERTLGIITKPDLLTSQSTDEDRFIRLARNQDKFHHLALGWHVLRNRGETESDLSSKERDAKEQEFFSSGIWSGIPSSNRGVDTIRVKLAKILLDHIRNSLPSMIKDIEENMADRQNRLTLLGEPRASPRQLRAHMDRIASRFQLLSLHAVEGNYSDDFFGGLYPDSTTMPMNQSRIKKLRALVRDLNRTFAYVLAKKGSRRKIIADGGDADEDNNDQTAELPPFLQVLECNYQFNDPEQVSRARVAYELESLSSANQGNEFPGTTNDRLAVKLFQDQSQPWESIASFHIDFLLRIAKSFVEMLVSYLTGSDNKTCTAILSDIVDPFFEKRTSLLETKLQELLFHFKSGYPQPLDADFRASLFNRRSKLLATEIAQDLLASRPDLFTEEGKNAIRMMSAGKQRSEFGVEDLIDKSETYYELSLRTFTDNVIVLATENCLIKDLPSILTTSEVSQMENDRLERLAAESSELQVERAELQAEYEALKKGIDLCKSYKSRKSTVVPTLQPQVTIEIGEHNSQNDEHLSAMTGDGFESGPADGQGGYPETLSRTMSPSLALEQGSSANTTKPISPQIDSQAPFPLGSTGRPDPYPPIMAGTSAQGLSETPSKSATTDKQIHLPLDNSSTNSPFVSVLSNQNTLKPTTGIFDVPLTDTLATSTQGKSLFGTPSAVNTVSTTLFGKPLATSGKKQVAPSPLLFGSTTSTTATTHGKPLFGVPSSGNTGNSTLFSNTQTTSGNKQAASGGLMFGVPTEPRQNVSGSTTGASRSLFTTSTTHTDGGKPISNFPSLGRILDPIIVEEGQHNYPFKARGMNICFDPLLKSFSQEELRLRGSQDRLRCW